MPLDPSIFGSYLKAPRSAAEYAGDFADLDAKRQALAGNALQQAFAQAKFDEYGRQVRDANALRDFQRSLAGKSDSDVLKAYRDAGYFAEAGALEKGMLDREKVKVDTQKQAVEAQKAFGEAQGNALKQYRGALDYIDTPAGAQRWLQAQYADPLLAGHMQALGPLDQALTRIPTDPQGFAQWRQQAGLGMEAWMKQQLEQQKARQTAANDVLTPDGQGGFTVNEPLVGAKARIAREGASSVNVGLQAPVQAIDPKTGKTVLVQPANKPGAKPQVLTDAGGQPFSPAADNAQKPLTEGQAKANLFGTRMQEADRILGDLAAQGTAAPSLAQQVTGGEGISGSVATALASPPQQQADQAQRDFINAVLRRESGAAISASEFSSARKQYFPQPGDSPAVIAQKARNRQTAIQGMLAEVPEGKRGIPGVSATAGPSLPSADAIAAELAKRGAK